MNPEIEIPVVLVVRRPSTQLEMLAADSAELMICSEVGVQGLQTTVEVTIHGIEGSPDIPGHATHVSLYLNDLIDGPLVVHLLDCDFSWADRPDGRVLLGSTTQIYRIEGPSLDEE